MVSKVSRINGWSIALIAAPATLLTLLLGDWFGAFIGALVTAAGVTEIHGHRLLKSGSARGCKLVKAAQVMLFSALWGYCLIQLTTFNFEKLYSSLPEDTQQMLLSLGLTELDLEPLIRFSYMTVYGGVMVASLLHQGGLFWFYRSRTQAVVKALSEESKHLKTESVA